MEEDEELGEELDQFNVRHSEDNFNVLTSRNNGPRSSNMSSNSDSSENSGLLRTDKVSCNFFNNKNLSVFLLIFVSLHNFYCKFKMR